MKALLEKNIKTRKVQIDRLLAGHKTVVQNCIVDNAFDKRITGDKQKREIYAFDLNGFRQALSSVAELKRAVDIKLKSVSDAGQKKHLESIKSDIKTNKIKELTTKNIPDISLLLAYSYGRKKP